MSDDGDEKQHHGYDARTAARIEARWQEIWERTGAHRTDPARDDGVPYFVVDMFPFPSGAGLHVGHPLGFVATDVAARFARMQGRQVLHAMGFDAFGLPTEQYAIETGRPPAETTAENVATYRRQNRRLGLGHDDTRSFSTTDPAYYRWTQWVFAPERRNRGHRRTPRGIMNTH